MSDSIPISDSDRTGQPNAIRIYVVVLTVGVICSLAIVTVYEFTRPIVRRNERAARQQAILEVLPGAVSTEVLGQDADGTFGPLQSDQDRQVFVGFDESEQLVGLAIEAQGVGYQDVIRLLYGYSFVEEAIIGIRVLESRETPGLGDRIEKDPAFLDNFRRLDVRLDAKGTRPLHPIEFVKPGKKNKPWQVDGITGATISSRAVAEMLATSSSEWIPIVRRHRSEFDTGTNKTKTVEAE